MVCFDIPMIDVSSLMSRKEDKDGKRKVIEQIEEACFVMASSRFRIMEFLWSCWTEPWICIRLSLVVQTKRNSWSFPSLEKLYLLVIWKSHYIQQRIFKCSYSSSFSSDTHFFQILVCIVGPRTTDTILFGFYSDFKALYFILARIQVLNI